MTTAPSIQTLPPEGGTSSPRLPRPVTVQGFRTAKGKIPLVCVTAYDAITAEIAQSAGVDLVLVGDSVGTVLQGHPTTLPVTLEEMRYHTRCVRGVLRDLLLITDLPFGTFQLGVKETLKSAILLLKEGAQGVKLEGGERILPQIQALVEHDIPVMGHLGLTPQSVHAFGGYRRQGKILKDRNRIFEDALKLEDAGVFALVLECVPPELAKAIRESLSIPVIGIGSGPDCDGQIVVFHDIVGLTPRVPSFVHPFASLREEAKKALSEYARMVRERSYPPCESSPG